MIFVNEMDKRKPIWYWIIVIAVIGLMLYLAIGSIPITKGNQIPISGGMANWTKVLTDPYQGLNINALTTYNGKLYCADYGEVKRYDGGTSWTQIGDDGLGHPNNAQVLSLVAFNDKLYASTNNFFDGTEVWAYDGANWKQVNTSGFGFGKDARTCNALVVYKDNLYAVVSYSGDGPINFRVYRYDGTGTTWTRVDTNAWGTGNDGLCAVSFGNYLYVGAGKNWYDDGHEAQVWRYDSANWEKVSKTGFGAQELSCQSFAVYNNELYCGTEGKGYIGNARVYRFDGGTSWSAVNSPGFNGTNDRVMSLCSMGKKLYAGTYIGSASGNPQECQVWSYTGSSWIQESTPGFGEDNFGAMTMTVYNAKLYVGTYGRHAEVWCTDGSTPTPLYLSTFYFAEGYTGTGFQTYLCLGNPNSSPATAEVTYLFNGGGTKEASYQVPANSRTTIDVNSEVGPDREVSIRVLSTTANLVAERPMYFNYQGVWTGGSDAVGATAPAKSWSFAEGTTLPGFDEYVTVLNPGSSAANLNFHYMIEGQGEQVVTGNVGAHSRATFKTVDQIGMNKNCSLVVDSDQEVVAERPMYFNYQGKWTGGHVAVGTTWPVKQWYFAEGSVYSWMDEWLCLQNPGSTDITVSASYMLGAGQGGTVEKSYVVPAKQRLTISVNQELGLNKDVSVKLSSSADFVAERPMYFCYHNAWDGGHDVLGAKDASQTWFLAEGYTGPGFDEWLCLQNPQTAETNVKITYYPKSGSGSPIERYWTLPAKTRLTINVNSDAGPNLEISARIESEQPIIVERPMYFNYNGWTGGHDVVGFVPHPAVGIIKPSP